CDVIEGSYETLERAMHGQNSEWTTVQGALAEADPYVRDGIAGIILQGYRPHFLHGKPVGVGIAADLLGLGVDVNDLPGRLLEDEIVQKKYSTAANRIQYANLVQGVLAA
ncbi:hypothetical protein ACFL1B_03695, partial [Nanoarchaeota archaeon]